MRKNDWIAVILSLFYLLLFLPYLGGTHLFDWDEINFAEAAREMLVSGNWLNVQINFEPFWEKPPLFIWLQAISMSIFGVTDFAARFPNVLIGLASILSLYYIANRHYSRQIAIAAVLLYIGSFTPHLYFKSGIIDPLYNLLIFHTVYQLIVCTINKRSVNFFLCGLLLGLSVLAKGPVSILLVGLSGLAYQLIYKNNFYTFKHLLILISGLVLIPGVWFSAQIVVNGWWFLQEFFVYQIELFSEPVASHGQPFYYHPLVLLFGCFPLFILSFGSLFKPKAHVDDTIGQWMKVLFWVVLIVFSVVTTKIVHYSSMCYLPLALLAAEWVCRSQKLYLVQKVLLLLIGALWGLLLFTLAHMGNSSDFMKFISKLIDDEFVKDQLATAVPWSPIHYGMGVISILLTLYLVFNYSKVNLMSFLSFNTLFLSVVLLQLVPRIESYTQAEWIRQLERYQGKEMMHFTVGFKSYAHLFYTRQSSTAQINRIKQEVLIDCTNGDSSFFALDRESKVNYDVLLRDEVINRRKIPISVSAKLDHKIELNNNPELIQVFEGNGYGVWERRN